MITMMKHFKFIGPSDHYWCRVGITGYIKHRSFTLGLITQQLWDGFFYQVDLDDESIKWHTLGFGIGYLTWVNHDKEIICRKDYNQYLKN